MRLFKHFKAAVLASGLLLSCVQPAFAEWHQVTTDNFVVYGEGSARAVVSEAEQLERLDRLMRQTLSLPPAENGRRLPVYLVNNLNELKEINPSLQRRTGGFYQASPFGIFATLIRGDDNHVLFHEYAHHFMMQNFPGHYPSWFVEGFAEYFATADVKTASRVSLGYFSSGRMYEVNNGQWISMEQLLTANPSNLNTAQRGNFYALSWLLTHYMISDTDRLKALGGYLAALRRGEEALPAFQASTGMTPEDLRKALKSYLNGKMRYGRFSMENARFDTQVMTLSAAANDFILPHAALQRPMSEEQAQQLLTLLRPKAARYPNDPMVLSVLANLELVWGDDAVAEQQLSHLLSLDPDHAEGLRLMAQRHTEAAIDSEDPDERIRRFNQAQTYLRQAMDADPTDFRVYRQMALIRHHAPNYPTENDVDILVMALTYAPQVTGLRMQTIDALRRRNMNEEADVLLSVLKSQPHAATASTPNSSSDEEDEDADQEGEPQFVSPNGLQ